MRKAVWFFALFVVCQINLAQDAPTTATNNLVGTWVGQWVSARGSKGAYEFNIRAFDGERMTGRVNSEAQDCTVGWTALSGNRVGDEIHGTYVLGGRCRQVQIVFPIPKGDVMEGRWTSEYPGNGTFRLSKKN